jgi:zinc protease
MARRPSWHLLPRLAMVIGLLATIALARPASAQVFNPETFTLANGLQVVVIANHRSPIVTHMVWYKTGAADEAWGKSGIAHFLEHLMFRGTREIAPGEFSKIVARNGGRDNAFTSYDYTGYFQNVSRDRLELVMKMEADRMAGLALTDAVVDPERDVILEERRQVVENRPGSLLREQMNAALFLNHPYGRPIIGWEHEMRGLRRADAVAWYETHYTPNNAILIVAGDITVADLQPLAEKYYGPVASRAVPPRMRPQEPAPRAARRIELKDPRVAQAAVTRSYLAPSYAAGQTEHAYALQVLAELLGGAATSRLNRTLVLEQQVATGAGAWYDPTALDLGTFGVSASARTGVEIDKVEAALDAQIQKLLTEGASEDEVERAKSRMRAAAVYARDSLSTGARVIGAALTTGQTIADVEAWPQRIGAVTAAQVNAAARAILQPERSVTGLLLPKPAS